MSDDIQKAGELAWEAANLASAVVDADDRMHDPDTNICGCDECDESRAAVAASALREAREQAWDEGALAREEKLGLRYTGADDNPYREGPVSKKGGE